MSAIYWNENDEPQLKANHQEIYRQARERIWQKIVTKLNPADFHDTDYITYWAEKADEEAAAEVYHV